MVEERQLPAPSSLLLHVPTNLESVCRVCMGPVSSDCLHCWLEAGETVADLTRPPRFFVRDDYYEQRNVQRDKVKRYSQSEVAAHINREGRLTFWDFDPSRYWTKWSPL